MMISTFFLFLIIIVIFVGFLIKPPKEELRITRHGDRHFSMVGLHGGLVKEIKIVDARILKEIFDKIKKKTVKEPDRDFITGKEIEKTTLIDKIKKSLKHNKLGVKK